MNFLITEILGSVALAVVFGAAVGWLIHRVIANRTAATLRSQIQRQHGELREAHEDNRMLAEDYEEIRERSTIEIDRLSRDNLQLPVLQQNLEKSQLLVRQMMKRHEAALRELKTENDVLRQRINTLNARDSARSHASPAATGLVDLGKSASAGPSVPASQTTDASASTEPSSTISNTAVAAATTATENLSDEQIPLSLDVDTEQDSAISTAAVAESTAAESTAADSTAAKSTAEAPVSSDTDTAAQASESDIASNVTRLPVEHRDDAVDEEDLEDAVIEVVADDLAFSDTEMDLEDAAEAMSDDHDEQPLFDSVEQHDDLQQIFGIGPVTERALNKLGITSYSQLAELKQHDIDKIADALQIFPGRIEQDNWVDNARRQLEEVLEEL